VLLVDLDPQGNTTSGLGIARDSERPTVYHALLGEHDARTAVLPTEVPHLFVLPSGADLVTADRVLVPLQCEYYALEGLSSLLRTIDLVRANLNRALELEGVVLTMFDARNNLAKQVMKDVQGHLPGQVYETVIPRNVRLSEAPSHGRPALLYDIESKGAQSYLMLATEMLRRHHAGTTERKRA
jgi:chromosome partitioning protein